MVRVEPFLVFPRLLALHCVAGHVPDRAARRHTRFLFIDPSEKIVAAESAPDPLHEVFEGTDAVPASSALANELFDSRALSAPVAVPACAFNCHRTNIREGAARKQPLRLCSHGACIALVLRVGVEPTLPEGGGVTVR